MGRNTRKRRSSLATKAIAASAALALGGGGLIWANFYASAHEENSGQNRTKAAGAQVATISCPDVGQKLTSVPGGAKANVDKELANLDKQITEAYARLASTRRAQTNDANFVQNAILGPLKEKRSAGIGRIKIDFKRVGAAAPDGLDNLAPCTGTPATGQTDAGGTGQNGGQAQNGGQGQNGGQDQNGGGQTGNGQDQNGGGQQAGNGGQDDNGPVAADFVDITKVKPNVAKKATTRKGGRFGRGGRNSTRSASTGTFTVDCGVNENKNYNTDNVIVAPGVTNGAHHTHDYVGNQDVNAFSNNDTFAAADTSCDEQGDKSSYYWPVMRVQDGTQEFDQDNDGGGKEGNVGKILTAKQAEIKYVGSATSKVVGMPKFLRIITGDAKAFTNGPANANAHFSCTGFENKVQLTDKYPICPKGSDVVRSFSFQSCWDGQNTDSANHRAHVAFADANGNCANGFKAIPQLTMRLVYAVPTPTIENGQVRNAYAVDGFPEQLHKPINDHDDFINIMDQSLMDQVVDCLNKGRTCGAGAPPANGTGDGKGDDTGGKGDGGKNDDGGTKDDGKGGNDGKEDDNGGKGDTGNGGATETPGKGGTQNGQDGQGDAKGSDDGAVTSGGTADTDTKADTKAGAGADTPKSESTAASDARRTEAGTAPGGSASPSAVSRAEGGDDQDSVGSVNPAPQAGGSQGSLAETGSQLWPAAAGALMLCAGLVVLLRSRRHTARR